MPATTHAPDSDRHASPGSGRTSATIRVPELPPSTVYTADGRRTPTPPDNGPDHPLLTVNKGLPFVVVAFPEAASASTAEVLPGTAAPARPPPRAA